LSPKREIYGLLARLDQQLISWKIKGRHRLSEIPSEVSDRQEEIIRGEDPLTDYVIDKCCHMDTPSCPCDAREQVEQNIYAPVYSRVSCLCLNDILSATESLRAA